MKDFDDDKNKPSVEWEGSEDIQDDLLALPTQDTSDSFFNIDFRDIEWDGNTPIVERPDIIMAICSGLITGVIDIVFVGSLSLDRCKEWGNKEANEIVKFVARCHSGYKGKDLNDAISFLEKTYPCAADGCTPEFGGGLQHHLRDFSHHPSIGGLAASLWTQFSPDHTVIGCDTNGHLIFVPCKSTDFIGETIEEKFFYGFLNWALHLISDMAGSSANPGAGTGIPGPLLSTLKEISSLPIFKDPASNEDSFRKYLSKLFNGTELKLHDENGRIIQTFRFDLRVELGALTILAAEAGVVVLNECAIRIMYMLRHLYLEVKRVNPESLKDLTKLNPAAFLPYRNPTLNRMLTIGHGIFTSADVVGALATGYIQGRSLNNPKMWITAAGSINYPGVVRLGVAAYADVKTTKEFYRKRRASKHEFEVNALDSLELDATELCYLYSLERLCMQRDFAKPTKDSHLKRAWYRDWAHDLQKRLGEDIDMDSYFLPENEVIAGLQELQGGSNEDRVRVDLIILEALLFSPYSEPIEADKDVIYFDKKGNQVEKKATPKNLSLDYDYLTEELPDKLVGFHPKYLKNLRKSYKRNYQIVSGNTNALKRGLGGTLIGAIAVGGIAFVAAPVIAPTLATTLMADAVVGLHGAALTSASLAALGGGSLAAGGFGMAGGTAVIAGGGSILTLAGGSAGTIIANRGKLNTDSIEISSAKLLTFFKCVSFEKYHSSKACEQLMNGMSKSVNNVVTEYEKTLTDDSKENKEAIKSYKKTISILKSCEEEMRDIMLS